MELAFLASKCRTTERNPGSKISYAALTTVITAVITVSIVATLAALFLFNSNSPPRNSQTYPGKRSYSFFLREKVVIHRHVFHPFGVYICEKLDAVHIQFIAVYPCSKF
jgi:hypothetical protein